MRGAARSDPEFNASFSQYGVWRRKAILRLGLPLLTILDPAARAALLSHELAHGANGDPRRGMFLGSAVDTLARWHAVLRPKRIFDRRLRGTVGMAAYISNLVMLGLSVVPWCGTYILIHLVWRRNRSGRSRANRLAARVAGTDAVLRVLDSLHLFPTMRTALQRFASTPTKAGTFSLH